MVVPGVAGTVVPGLTTSGLTDGVVMPGVAEGVAIPGVVAGVAGAIVFVVFVAAGAIVLVVVGFIWLAAACCAGVVFSAALSQPANKVTKPIDIKSLFIKNLPKTELIKISVVTEREKVIY